MNREPEIEALLNAARDAGIAACEGLTANKSALAQLARHMLAFVRAQADAGLWRKWMVMSAADLHGLGCKAEIDRGTLLAFGRAPIRITWDFKNTTLRFLETVAA